MDEHALKAIAARREHYLSLLSPAGRANVEAAPPISPERAAQVAELLNAAAAGQRKAAR